MTLFDGPIAAQARPKPAPDDDKIVMWQVVYGDGPRAVTREMNVQAGFAPPLKTQWNGMSYSRFYINFDAYSVTYMLDVDTHLNPGSRSPTHMGPVTLRGCDGSGWLVLEDDIEGGPYKCCSKCRKELPK